MYLVIIILPSGKGVQKTHTYRPPYLTKAAEIAEDGEKAGADVSGAVRERLLQMLMGGCKTGSALYGSYANKWKIEQEELLY